MVSITNFAHGTTVDNRDHRSSGWNDAPLSQLGIEQGTKLKEHTKDMTFDIVFASDLSRAYDTAELAFGDRFEIVQDARLRECNYGDLNGASSDIVEPLQEKEMHATPFPNGESYEDVKARMADFLAFLKEEYDGKRVALVSHKAPQLALDVLLKGMTWDEALANDWRKTKAWQPGWEYILP